MLLTNAVEILGERLNLGCGAVESVLAAVGRALPETMIPLVAIAASLLTGSSGSGAISIEAIIGTPFLLTTPGMFVVGASALGPLLAGAARFLLLSLGRPLRGSYLLVGDLIYAGFVAVAVATVFVL